MKPLARYRWSWEENRPILLYWYYCNTSAEYCPDYFLSAEVQDPSNWEPNEGFEWIH